MAPQLSLNRSGESAAPRLADPAHRDVQTARVAPSHAPVPVTLDSLPDPGGERGRA
jgi:hypothetical protein